MSSCVASLPLRLVRLAALLTVAGLLSAFPPRTAEAHKPYLKATIIRIDGLHEDGFLKMRPNGDGKIDLWLPGAPKGARLVVDYRLNGVAKTGFSYALQGARSAWPLGFDTDDQDKIEIANLRVVDADGHVIAVFGAAADQHVLRIFTSPLVWVVDTLSDVGFTRGGDTFLSKDGDWTVGFDALRSRATGRRLDNQGNYARIEVSVNDGVPQTFTVTFDVQSGKSRPNGRPGRNIGTRPGDRVRIHHVDVFDAQGNLFATTGIRMGPQGHYFHELPPVPTPSPTPTPSASPRPTATPSASPTPDATASPQPTPDATATPDPTPAPTPSPDATPEATATPDLTPEPTADATPTAEATPEETPTPDQSPGATPQA